MKVFLTGATGYIGVAITDALQTGGYQVVGLARSEEAVRRLRAKGVHPLRGDLHDTQLIADAAREADAVIHAGLTNRPDAPQVDTGAVAAILDALDGTGKRFIYTSGVWVMGNSGPEEENEDSQLKPTPLAAWRPEIEHRTQRASERGVRSVVIRPALVYGRGQGVIGMMVQSARQDGAARFVGTGENRWTLVHVDDLADLYLLALKRAPAGTLLIAAHGPAVRVREIAEAASRAAGADGRTQAWPVEEARKVMGLYADALVLDQQISGAKAKQLLNWEPHRPTLFEELEHGSYRQQRTPSTRAASARPRVRNGL